tara:strand:+ start:1447 stop:1659 length:213 start_codon:yes stop_codon:yes gene_type:complete
MLTTILYIYNLFKQKCADTKNNLVIYKNKKYENFTVLVEKKKLSLNNLKRNIIQYIIDLLTKLNTYFNNL